MEYKKTQFVSPNKTNTIQFPRKTKTFSDVRNARTIDHKPVSHPFAGLKINTWLPESNCFPRTLLSAFVC